MACAVIVVTGTELLIILSWVFIVKSVRVHVSRMSWKPSSHCLVSSVTITFDLDVTSAATSKDEVL